MPLTSHGFQDKGPESGGSWETRQELLWENKDATENALFTFGALLMCAQHISLMFFIVLPSKTAQFNRNVLQLLNV